MSCHKANVVITGRTHCFHDCIYITILRPSSCFCEIWAICMLFIYITYIYVYIYIYIIHIIYIYIYSLSKSNNYSLKSAHHKSVIISHWLNFENCETKPYINDVILRIPLYCKFLMIVVPGWRLSAHWHETLSTK